MLQAKKAQLSQNQNALQSELLRSEYLHSWLKLLRRSSCHEANYAIGGGGGGQNLAVIRNTNSQSQIKSTREE